MYLDIENKEERSTAIILTIISEHEQTNRVNKKIEYLWDKNEKNNLSWKRWTSLLTSMILNQEPLRHGTMAKLGLIPMEVEQGHLYLHIISGWNIVEGAN